MSTASAPIEISHVLLIVNDLQGMGDFYAHSLGLTRLESDPGTVRLGVGGRLLLELRKDRSARRPHKHEAGLFHTAFLLPDRHSLAGWLRHAVETRLKLQGASDHRVSEAIYLADPEGNGIEVYVDRARSSWHDQDGNIRMTTQPLDLRDLSAFGAMAWTGAPDSTVVGHVHLQVGAIAEAETFVSGTIGLPVMARYPGAVFFGSGGYHHHLAANVWNSRGSGARKEPTTGLAEIALSVHPDHYAEIVARGGSDRIDDPWGTTISVQAALD